MSCFLDCDDIGVSFQIGGVNSALSLILGPCVIENRDSIFFHADKISKIRDKYPQFNFIFKSSYDKANRTSMSNFRGVGIDEGLEILSEVRKNFGIPILSDVHGTEDIKKAAEKIDILQIPAFLCRQTDLLIAAGKTGKTVLVKKGQFLHPEDMKFAAEKVRQGGTNNILLCERGTCFGYRDLVVDFRSFMIMHDLGFPVVFDVTHSVQSMGGADGKSSGNRKYVEALARAGVAFGVDALFLECHNDPDNAPSDGPNMISFTQLDHLLSSILRMERE